MTKIVSLTKIKNESDIVEAFVRYHVNIFDEMYFVENGSFDGTYEILCALKKEGLPITIFDESGSEFEVERFANEYLYKAAELSKADWIVPIDTDEFLSTKNRNNPRSYLMEQDTGAVLSIHWRTYIYKDVNEQEPFLPDQFHCYRLEEYESTKKIIVPAMALKNKDFYLLAGYHSWWSSSGYREISDDNLILAHYPVRSILQIKKQLIVNRIGKIMRDENASQSWHWKSIYNQLKSEQIDLESISMHYASSDEREITLTEGGITTDFCDCLTNRYDGLKRNGSLEEILVEFAENLAIKIRMLQSSGSSPKTIPWKKKKLIIYGTGKAAESKVRLIDKNRYEIVAYADSDSSKYYTKFMDSFIIPKEKMYMLEFDCIVIASNLYYEEIRDMLMTDPRFSGKIVRIEELLLESFTQ